MPFLRSPLCQLIGRLWHVSTGRVIELIDTIGSEADNSLLQNRPIVIESEQFEAPPDELRKVCFYLFRERPSPVTINKIVRAIGEERWT